MWGGHNSGVECREHARKTSACAIGSNPITHPVGGLRKPILIFNRGLINQKKLKETL